ncbi:MAG: RNA polymerase sigma factor [Proteobacteria bacterium]|nr:RNA polymerase sigma factor [Pseudomonadota bacterium]
MGLSATLNDALGWPGRAPAASASAKGLAAASVAASDADLAAAAVQGSKPAFDRIVGLHQQAVRSFLRRLCGDAAEADDLAQETFVAAWSGLWRFKGESSLRSWLCAIAWRKHQDWARSRRRAARREAQAGQPDGSAMEARPDTRLDLTAALAALPADQRAAVALCLGADFSHAEAAAALELPLGTIKSHVARGREKLVALLADKTDGGPHDGRV